MLDKKEFDEFVAEVSYLNESTKSLIKEIKEADKMSINLKETLTKLENISNKLTIEINNTICSNIDKQVKSIVEENLREFVNNSKHIKDISISISQTIDILGKSAKKIDKQKNKSIVTALLFVIFFVAGVLMQDVFKIVHF